MVTPIRPSLAQMLNGSAPTTPQPATSQTAQATSFTSALAAQKSFFQQVASGQVASGQAPATAPQRAQTITPATFTAADVARSSAQAAATDPNAPLKRPGSFLNIVV